MNDRLINATKLKDEIMECAGMKRCLNEFEEGLITAYERVIDYIDEQPTIDAVPVIRCKDCVHKMEFIEGVPACDSLMTRVHYDFYCANGKRKEVRI